MTSTLTSNNGGAASEERGSDTIIKEFLLKREPHYRRFMKMKQIVNPFNKTVILRGRTLIWRLRDGQTRSAMSILSANANKLTTSPKAQLVFFNMMKGIGDELHSHTRALSILTRSSESLRILDLCMASGGYSASASTSTLPGRPGAALQELAARSPLPEYHDTSR